MYHLSSPNCDLSTLHFPVLYELSTELKTGCMYGVQHTPTCTSVSFNVKAPTVPMEIIQYCPHTPHSNLTLMRVGGLLPPPPSPWRCFVGCLHSISDVLPVPFSHLTHHFATWSHHRPSIRGIRPLLSPTHIHLEGTIDTVLKCDRSEEEEGGGGT